MYNENESRQQQGDTVKFMALYDPYVVQTLETVQGSNVVVQTCQGSIRGQLSDVKPDHVVIQSDGASFFIRIQQIIWIMPN